jgi:hypothetical protein
MSDLAKKLVKVCKVFGFSREDLMNMPLFQLDMLIKYIEVMGY